MKREGFIQVYKNVQRGTQSATKRVGSPGMGLDVRAM